MILYLQFELYKLLNAYQKYNHCLPFEKITKRVAEDGYITAIIKYQVIYIISLNAACEVLPFNKKV